MQRFADRTAVITGAGGRTGRALAIQAASLGMSVVAADIDEPALAETVDTLTSGGATATGVRTDVADAASMSHLAEVAFDQYGSVHLLCNNAGVYSGGLLWERPIADFAATLGVNVYGIVHAIHAFVPRMLQQRHDSHIVNRASMGGLVARASSGAYGASKFAALGLTESLAHDLAAVRARIGVSVLLTAARRGGPCCELTDQQIAEAVFDAVGERRFYIPTQPSFDCQLTERHRDQLARRLPRLPDQH